MDNIYKNVDVTNSALRGKDTIKVLFIRPPYHLWPIINESDNFLMPLNFPCLSAYLKEKMEGVEIKAVDCLPLRVGWRSLREIIIREKPDVVGVGDKVCYYKEGMRAIKLAKELNPEVVTVAGGHFHSNLPEYSLNNFPHLDYVIRYEGEETLVDLLTTLRDGGDPSNVKSIAYRDGSGVVCTSPRPLIDDLNLLPMPDYDIMPIEKYSPFGKLWPRAVTIQGSRGCAYNCTFCSWAVQEGEHIVRDGKWFFKSRFRQKSVEKVMEEIEILYERYGIRYLFWVEGTWNHDHEWVNDLCEEILRRNYKLGWWAFVRSDLLLEQEELGILEKMVRAGFRHTLIGGERPANRELEMIGKNDLDETATKKASWLLERKYPEVFRQATFITGIRTETRESIEELGKYTRDCHLDFTAYHPFMPWPGTPFFEESGSKGWIEHRDYSRYDMFQPVMSSESLSREEISHLTQKLYKDFIFKQPFRFLRGLFSRYPMRRRLNWWFLFSVNRVLLRDLYLSLLGRKKFEGFGAIGHLWKPRWYDS